MSIHETTRSIDDFFHRHQVRRGFSAAIIKEVAEFQHSPGIDDPNLEDLTQLPFVTIDHDDSKDLDQALYIEETDAGYRVFYALADGAYYVRPGSALFDEALLRGASFYLPGLCEPMLPRALSEDLVSLNAQVDRRALVFIMSLDTSGHCLKTQIVRARVRSRAKLTYGGVQDFLDDSAKSPLSNRDFTDSLRRLKTVGLLRLAEARSRSVVRFDRSEIWLSRDALGFKVLTGQRYDVERYNEQISLLCNMEGAAFLQSDGPVQDHIQGIYRVHPAPEKHRLIAVAKRIDAIVMAQGLDATIWAWRMSDEPLGDYLDRLPRDGDLGRITLAIQRQIRYTFQRSDFRSEPGPHFGVGAPAYCRFSSPMREIAGIFTHKEAIQKLERSLGNDAEDERLRRHVIAIANRAKTIQGALQKSVHKLALDTLFLPELDKPLERRSTYRGTIMGLRESRLYVELDTPPVEVKVYTRDITEHDERFRIEDGVSLASPQHRFQLGDGVDIHVLGYDEARLRWRLSAVPYET